MSDGVLKKQLEEEFLKRISPTNLRRAFHHNKEVHPTFPDAPENMATANPKLGRARLADRELRKCYSELLGTGILTTRVLYTGLVTQNKLITCLD